MNTTIVLPSISGRDASLSNTRPIWASTCCCNHKYMSRQRAHWLAMSGPE
ncbi:Uncharacterised protein [Mycobacteroides abscessus subsp. abscessus]|nr:Uncharacterised protein [Mycobacteroides abscessus subsp. abscessus]